MNVNAVDTVTLESSSPTPFSVTVNKPLISPQVLPITTTNLFSGQVMTTAVTATDVIGDSVHFSLVGAPSWISIDPNVGVIAVSPPLSVGGSYSMTVFATDVANPNLVGTQSFTANVQGVTPQVTASSTTGSAKKGISALTVFFNEPMDENTAGNSGNYTVLVSTTAKGKAKKSIAFFAQFNASNNSVTLTLSKKQKFHISMILNGGILSQSRAPLGNSVSARREMMAGPTDCFVGLVFFCSEAVRRTQGPGHGLRATRGPEPAEDSGVRACAGIGGHSPTAALLIFKTLETL